MAHELCFQVTGLQKQPRCQVNFSGCTVMSNDTTEPEIPWSVSHPRTFQGQFCLTTMFE
jgi:hypothetical protein